MCWDGVNLQVYCGPAFFFFFMPQIFGSDLSSSFVYFFLFFSFHFSALTLVRPLFIFFIFLVPLLSMFYPAPPSPQLGDSGVKLVSSNPTQLVHCLPGWEGTQLYSQRSHKGRTVFPKVSQGSHQRSYNTSQRIPKGPTMVGLK